LRQTTRSQTRPSSDNICKVLAETYPEQLIEWLFGTQGVETRVLKTEISREPIHADSVILLASEDTVFHIEFQTAVTSDPPPPLRMLDYYVGLKRKFADKQVKQVLVMLRETGEGIPDRYEGGRVVAVYDVVKMWEQDPQPLLEHEGLLPLATLCRDESHGEKLLQVIASKLSEIDDTSRRVDQIVSARVLAGLRYLDRLVYQILRGGDMLEESSVYQEILKKGFHQGIEQGREQGEKLLVLKQLKSKMGKLSLETKSHVEELHSDKLEELAQALLDFTSEADLRDWLRNNTTY